MSDQPAEPTTEDVSSETVVVDRARALAGNPLYIALAVAVALLVLFLAWTFALSPLLLGEGTDDVDEVDVVAQPTPRTTPVVPEATPTPGIVEDDLDEPPLGTVELFLARDPFQPVRPEPAPAPTDPDGTAPATDPGVDPTDPDDPTAPRPGDPDDPTARPPGEADDPPQEDRKTVEGRRYELVDVRMENGRARAVMNVDGANYTVAEGDTFLENPQVAIREIDVDSQCVVFLHGDQRQRLCEGEAVLK